MYVLIFSEFGLKMPIHTPLAFGEFDPLNWEQYQQNLQKAHPCAEGR